MPVSEPATAITLRSFRRVGHLATANRLGMSPSRFNRNKETDVRILIQSNAAGVRCSDPTAPRRLFGQSGVAPTNRAVSSPSRPWLEHDGSLKTREDTADDPVLPLSDRAATGTAWQE